jgi:hypothetical protein
MIWTEEKSNLYWLTKEEKYAILIEAIEIWLKEI